MKGFNTTIKGVKGSLKSVNKAASKTEKALQNALQIKTSNLTREYDTFSKTFSGMKKSFSDFTSSFGASSAQMQASAAKSAAVLENLQKIKGWNPSLGYSVEEFEKRLESTVNAAIKARKELVNLFNTPISPMTDEKGFDDWYQKIMASKDAFTSSVDGKVFKTLSDLGVFKKSDKPKSFGPEVDDAKLEQLRKQIKDATTLPEMEAKINIDKAKQNLANLKQILKDETSQLKQMESQLVKCQKEIDKLASKYHSTVDNFISVTQSITGGEPIPKADLENQFPQLVNINKKLDEQKKIYEEITGKITEQKQKIEQTKNAIESQNQSIQQAKQNMKDLNKQTRDSARQTRYLGKMIKSFLFFRAANTVFTQVEQNIRECYDLLMQFDNNNNNLLGYNTTISNLVSEFKILGATLAITVANFLEIAGPVLQTVLGALTQIADAVNVLWAALSGKSEYTTVNKDYWKNYAEGLKEANKEQKRFLAGFDELTVLQKNDTKEIKPEELFKKEKIDTASVVSATVKLAALAGIVAALTKLFNKKNKSLGTQTEKTKKESSAVGALATQFALAAAGAGALAGALGDVFKVPEPQESPVYALEPALAGAKQEALETVPAMSKVGEAVKALSLLPVPSFAPVISVAGLLAGIPLVQEALAGLRTIFQVEGETVGAGITSWFTLKQEELATVLETTGATTLASLALALAGVGSLFTTHSTLWNEIFNQSGAQLQEDTTNTTNNVLGTASSFATTLLTIFAGAGVGMFSAMQNPLMQTQNLFSAFSQNGNSIFQQFSQGTLQIISSWGAALLAAIQSVISQAQQIISSFLSSLNLSTSSSKSSAKSTSKAYSTSKPSPSYYTAKERQKAERERENSAIKSGMAAFEESFSSKVSSIGNKAHELANIDIPYSTYSKEYKDIQGKALLGALETTGALAGLSSLAEIFKVPALGKLFAFADGGVVTTPTPALVGEYQGARSNPEIITPQSIMKETVENANESVVNAVFAIGNQIVKAIEDKDTNVYMDTTKVTRKITREQENQARYKSSSMVSFG